eukprot:SAG31_NODE_2037_length_6604_cov_2.820600_4_plen_246_part_00
MVHRPSSRSAVDACDWLKSIELQQPVLIKFQRHQHLSFLIISSWGRDDVVAIAVSDHGDWNFDIIWCPRGTRWHEDLVVLTDKETGACASGLHFRCPINQTPASTRWVFAKLDDCDRSKNTGLAYCALTTTLCTATHDGAQFCIPQNRGNSLPLQAASLFASRPPVDGVATEKQRCSLPRGAPSVGMSPDTARMKPRRMVCSSRSVHLRHCPRIGPKDGRRLGGPGHSTPASRHPVESRARNRRE